MNAWNISSEQQFHLSFVDKFIKLRLKVFTADTYYTLHIKSSPSPNRRRKKNLI